MFGLVLSLREGDWRSHCFKFILISLLWLDTGDVIVPWCFAPPLYRLDSDPSLSVFIMAACRTDLCRLRPQDTVSIEFEVAWHFFCMTLAWFVSPWKSVRPIPVLRRGWWAVFQHGRLSWAPPSWILNSAPDWLKINSAILDLENNWCYCSPNNSLLSFSAPDWLPVI